LTTTTTTKDLNVAVIVKLEPDFSEGNVSYNADGTLNRAETKSILGPHSAIASNAAFYAKVKYGARIAVGTMGPPIAESALQQAQLLCDADELHLYSDRLFAGADTLATAEVLKAGVSRWKVMVKSISCFPVTGRRMARLAKQDPRLLGSWATPSLDMS